MLQIMIKQTPKYLCQYEHTYKHTQKRLEIDSYKRHIHIFAICYLHDYVFVVYIY